MIKVRNGVEYVTLVFNYDHILASSTEAIDFSNGISKSQINDRNSTGTKTVNSFYSKNRSKGIIHHRSSSEGVLNPEKSFEQVQDFSTVGGPPNGLRRRSLVQNHIQTKSNLRKKLKPLSNGLKNQMPEVIPKSPK